MCVYCKYTINIEKKSKHDRQQKNIEENNENKPELLCIYLLYDRFDFFWRVCVSGESAYASIMALVVYMSLM